MTGKKRYVVLNGGLGNQLWQLSFAHLISRFGPVVLVHVKKSEKGSPEDTSSVAFLKRVLVNCHHDIHIETFNFRNVLTRARFVPESRYFFPHNKIMNTRENGEFLHEMNDLEDFSIFLGYYQDLGLLSCDVETVLDEIIGCLNQETIHSDKLDDVVSFIHVRGGDYLEARHRSILGVLNLDYYSYVLDYLSEDLRKMPIIITNDSIHAQKVLPNFDAFEVLGPDQANEWESFRIMANSNLAVIANSTFSWWGGMVARRRGGRLIAPFPWTLKEKECGLVSHKIYAEGTEKIPSSFSY